MFCGISEKKSEESSQPKGLMEQLAELRQHTDVVTLSGGEPTLSPYLLECVREAYRLDFRRIAIQSNGSFENAEEPCSDQNDVQRAKLIALRDAGMTEVQVSIHSMNTDCQAYLTGRKQSSDYAFHLLSTARRLAIPASVNTVITRSNYRELALLPAPLAGAEVKAWHLVWPQVIGRARINFARIVPTLSIAVPYMLHAVAKAESRSLKASITGVPHCLLGPYVRIATEAAAGPTRFATKCSRCSLRSRCSGLDPRYMARFGDGELRPQRLPPSDNAFESTSSEKQVGTMSTPPTGWGSLFELDPSETDPSAEEKGREIRLALPVIREVNPREKKDQ